MMDISNDSLAILLLCSQLALDGESAKTFTTKEWSALARDLQATGLRPADLLEISRQDMHDHLALDDEMAGRIWELTARGDELRSGLYRLANVGIFPLTRADPDYPEKYKQRLKEAAPPVLFYAGEPALLGQPGIAVVGSRRLDPAGQECARFVGNACGLSGLVLYSGGAKGVDTISMESALEARGCAVGVLAHSLEATVKAYKETLKRGDLCLVSPYKPDAGFSAGNAMGRNRLIYTLADYAIVVASDAQRGGTWAGASEALRKKYVPVFVLEHSQMPEGNKLLLERGALPFPHPFKEVPTRLADWLEENIPLPPPQPSQPSLF